MDRVRAKSAWAVTTLITAALASSGCYRYELAQPDLLVPGAGLRVLVTRAGAVELAEVTQVAWETPIFNGTLVAMEGDDLLLSVPVAQRQVGFLSTNLNQTIRVPTAEIVSLQRRELDTWATALTIGGAAGLVIGLVAFIVSDHRGDPPPPGPPPDDFFSHSFFSIRLGR